MKQEVLRLYQVTVIEQGAAELNRLTLNVFAGEIMGLIPVNGTGLPTLLRILRQNIPLHYGYVYYRERLVNHWLNPMAGYNRIGIIESRSGLADDLTVADNVFVLRQGFKKHIIHRRTLNRLLEPFLQEINIKISANAYARDLTAFERFVVEIVKAVVAGCRLIVLNDAGAIVSDIELSKLREMLLHYAKEGISFIYVSRHYEEIRPICDRVALMSNGQITKILTTKETEPSMIHGFGVDNFERLILSQARKRALPSGAASALSFANLISGAISGLTLSIDPGECVVIQDLENRVIDRLLALVTLESKAKRGSILVAGRPLCAANGRHIGVIQRLAPKTMLFPELSYIDNLCFTIDHRLSRVWLNPKAKEGIRKECASWLGADVFDKHVDALTSLEKYDLIYTRILVQRPKVVFCVQPFMDADVSQRMHIWTLIERLLQKGIAVVILAVNLADTLSLADRLVRIQNGRISGEYKRSDFGKLPNSPPWQHLWQEPEETGF